MSTQQRTIANILLNTQEPTQLAFDDLYTWVIWQFPRKTEGGLCGAVHPPIAEHQWIPAIIQPSKKSILIYEHLDKTFPSPETAADYLHNHSNKHKSSAR